MTNRKTILRMSIALAALTILVGGTADAQVPKAEQNCIKEINNGARKVSLAENQEIGTCMKSYVKGLLGGTVAQCAAPPLASKVQKQIDRALSNANKKCTGGPPSFGPPSTSAHTVHAVASGAAILGDLFGSNVEATLLTSKLGSSCQAAIQKAVRGCQDTRIKEFNGCKGRGLRDGTIQSTASLESQCLGVGPEQPDPKGKIRIACQAKILNAATKCVGTGIPLASAFPACGETTAGDLMDCLDRRTRCRTCALVNAVDGTIKDCDVADDGDDGNNTCPEPTTCGDLLIDGTENCEDGDASGSDGCSSACQVETGWTCGGAPPQTCAEICGDGLIVGSETCDDGGTSPGDGCSATCQIETGYACSGAPSSCAEICGDGLIVGDEECDDGNTQKRDGCNNFCFVEAGSFCTGEPSICDRYAVVIDSPAHGSFTTASGTTLTGHVVNLPPAQAVLSINGTPVAVQPNGTFSLPVSLDAGAIFNSFRADLTDSVNGGIAHDRVTIARGESVADGGFSNDTIGLRLNDTGLDAIEPLVEDLVGDGLDLATLLPVGTQVVNDACVVELFGACIGSVDVSIRSPAPSLGGLGLALDSMTNFVATDITLTNVDVHVQIDGSGVAPGCGNLPVHANAIIIMGDYTLSPQAGMPENIDVNQTSTPIQVVLSGFDADTGACGGLSGLIYGLVEGTIEDQLRNALVTFLNDADGPGAGDSVINDAIEDALSGLSIAEPIGEALGVNLEAPLSAIPEDVNGITLRSNARVTSVIGTNPGECIPPPGAPNLSASLAFTEPFPTFGLTTPPPGPVPYEIAIALSAEAFNQLLKAQVECGLLITTITEIDPLGLGTPVPITAGILVAAGLTEFNAYPSGTLFRLDIRPTLAPIVTGAAGPSGEITELRVAGIAAELVTDDGSEEVALGAAFDANIGLDLLSQPGSIGFVLADPLPGALVIQITDNPLGVNEATLENDLLPGLVAGLLPSLAGSFGSLPLPEFLGIELEPVALVRSGFFLGIYANLNVAP